jgi:TatD family-associated radical SAM protein
MTIAYDLGGDALYLNVTNRCSNDCTFCVRRSPGFSIAGYPMRLSAEPEAAQVLAAIQEADTGAAARDEPYAEVVFCGFGEPTYRLDVISAVGRALRASGRRVRLNTNGHPALIHGRDPLPDLLGAVDELSVSLNAPDPARYLALCRPRFGAAAHPALLALAADAARSGLAVTLTVVGFTLAPEEIEAARAVARRLGVGFRVR